MNSHIKYKSDLFCILEIFKQTFKLVFNPKSPFEIVFSRCKFTKDITIYKKNIEIKCDWKLKLKCAQGKIVGDDLTLL